MKLTAAQATFMSLDIPGSSLTQFLIPGEAVVRKLKKKKKWFCVHPLCAGTCCRGPGCAMLYVYLNNMYVQLHIYCLILFKSI
jgi:hypothetical protein